MDDGGGGHLARGVLEIGVGHGLEQHLEVERQGDQRPRIVSRKLRSLLSIAKVTNFIPPQEIVSTYTRFQSFYFDKHSGRKLTWLWQLSKGEIKVNYVKNTKIPFTFLVSTYQMAILLLFNDSDTIAYEAIQQATRLSAEHLDPSLSVFVKAKVLIPSPETGKPEPGTTYSLNYNFKNKKVKVNLNITVKSEAKQEVEDTHKTIEEDRKLLIQVSNPSISPMYTVSPPNKF